MEKSKIIKLAVAAGTILAVGGFFGLQQWANGKAEREVRRMLIEADLDRVVRYGGVSASLLGRAVTLNDARLTSPEGRGPDVSVKKITASDIETNRDGLSALRIRMTGLSVPLLEMAREKAKPGGDEALYRLIGMGYQNVTGTAEVYFHLDLDKQRGTFEASVDLDNFGATSFKLGLDRLDARITEYGRQIRNAARTQDPTSLIKDAPAMVDLLARLELSDLSVAVKDRGVRKQLLLEMAEDDLILQSPDRLAVDVGALVTKGLREKLDQQRVDPKLAADIAGKVGQYVEAGGELKLTTRIDRSIPLFERGGFFGILPSPFMMSLERFFSITGARIER